MWKTLDICPSSIRNDPQVQAACEAIDKELEAIYGCMSEVPGGILFWPFLDQQVEPMLDVLAWEYHVDIWQGWQGSLDLETKRALVNASIDWHRHLGTRYAVDEMLKVVFKQGRVTEWFEYGGRPYYFRITFEGDITGVQWDAVLEAIYAVKNVRSWLDLFGTARQQQQNLWHGIATTQHLTTRIKYVEPGPPPAPAFDPAALDFFSRANITNATQKDAVNKLVVTLKTSGIWPKVWVMYPFVGGTETSHSHNLCVASNQISWSGLVTHNVNGITGAGGVGDTNLNVNLTPFGSVAFGVYNKSSNVSPNPDIQALASSIDYSIYTKWTDNHFYGGLGSAGVYVDVPITEAKGFYIATRQSETMYKVFRNGAQLGPTQSDVPNSLPSANFKLLANHNLALAFVSNGLSDSECITLSTAVETFQTALGRKN